MGSAESEQSKQSARRDETEENELLGRALLLRRYHNDIRERLGWPVKISTLFLDQFVEQPRRA